MGQPRIMIVEDEGIVSLDLQGQLTSLGYSVAAVAASGEEAIRKARIRAGAIRRRRTLWQTAVPLAAAAGITGIVLQSSGHNGLENTWQPQGEQALPAFEVQASPGKDVAVFEVADRPDVVVIWFLERGDD